MPEQVTVHEIDNVREWTTPDGQRTYKIIEATYLTEGGDHRFAEWFRNHDADTPKVGDSLFLEFFQKNGKPRCRLAKKDAFQASAAAATAAADANGVGGVQQQVGPVPPRPYDRDRSIIYQSCQKAAAAFLAGTQATEQTFLSLAEKLVAQATSTQGPGAVKADSSCPPNETPARISSEKARDLAERVERSFILERDAIARLITLGAEGRTLRSALANLTEDKVRNFEVWIEATESFGDEEAA